MRESMTCRVAFLLFAVVGMTQSSAAHPGNGIVVAKDGTVYFSDVSNRTIWMIAPDGTLTPRVRNRWTHSLALGADGTLYYEREEPGEGIVPGTFWKITPSGEHTRLIAPESDRSVFTAGDFVIDAGGNVYFPHTERDADNKWRTRIMRRTPEGTSGVFTGAMSGPLYRDGAKDVATIRIVTAMAPGPGESIYFTDRDHLRTVAPDGRVTTIKAGLIDARPIDPPEKRGPPTTINRLYGLAVGPTGTAYIAYHAGRRIIRVDPTGTVDVVHRTKRPWSPIGVAVAGDGIYVLESGFERGNDTPGPRVRRVASDGTVTTLAVVPKGGIVPIKR